MQIKRERERERNWNDLFQKENGLRHPTCHHITSCICDQLLSLFNNFSFCLGRPLRFTQRKKNSVVRVFQLSFSVQQDKKIQLKWTDNFYDAFFSLPFIICCYNWCWLFVNCCSCYCYHLCRLQTMHWKSCVWRLQSPSDRLSCWSNWMNANCLESEPRANHSAKLKHSINIDVITTTWSRTLLLEWSLSGTHTHEQHNNNNETRWTTKKPHHSNKCSTVGNLTY